MNYFNYFTEIEETFIRRRGKHLLLSPLDWALMESWQEREIPLRIVLRGIENVFDAIDKNPNRVRTIKSLTYCREEVEAQYADWLGRQVGKHSVEDSSDIEANGDQAENIEKNEQSDESGLFSDETIKSHLENIIELTESAKAKSNEKLRQVLDKVLEKLSEHKNAKTNAEKLEESLNALEALIDKSLIESIDKESLDQLKKQVESDLATHKTTMDKEVYQRTFDLMLLKKLREDSEIPRLSLFYL